MSRFSKPRLERLHGVLSGCIEGKQMPGLVAAVGHQYDVHFETIGDLSFARPVPMKRDTIFRIASISKLVNAVAAMILIEECRMRLDDSIETWLPELAHRRVLKSIESPLDDTVPARHPITVRDLMTFTMGIGTLMAMPDTYPIQNAIRELRIGGDGPPMPTKAPATEDWLKRLASLPLIAQPGERWMYHVSSDVLSVLIARVAGKSPSQFMKERIFDPLGMKDTGFFVPPEKIDRLAAIYVRSRETNALDLYDSEENSAWASEPPFESGGGGLVSTIDDYFAFCRMLLNKGRYRREQILSRASVELMTADHLTPAQRADSEIFLGTHSSWAFGMAVDIRRNEIYQNPGRFGWTGGFGTTAYVDPANEMIAVLFTQRMMESPEPPQVFTDFFTLAYGALE